MTTGELHEYYKILLDKFVDVVTWAMGIDHVGAGQKTWSRRSRSEPFVQ
jgi:hypothetical protein